MIKQILNFIDNENSFNKIFKNWTSGNSGNKDIDKFIQHIQLSANKYTEILEW